MVALSLIDSFLSSKITLSNLESIPCRGMFVSTSRLGTWKSRPRHRRGGDELELLDLSDSDLLLEALNMFTTASSSPLPVGYLVHHAIPIGRA